jgi:hypothetical protein
VIDRRRRPRERQQGPNSRKSNQAMVRYILEASTVKDHLNSSEVCEITSGETETYTGSVDGERLEAVIEAVG